MGQLELGLPAQAALMELQRLALLGMGLQRLGSTPAESRGWGRALGKGGRALVGEAKVLEQLKILLVGFLGLPKLLK